MAITLNKQAVRCEKTAIAQGKITPLSSSRASLYEISRKWRMLLDATSFPSKEAPQWSEREITAAEMMVETLVYLRRIGCDDIEQLLRDVIERQRQ